MVAPGRAVVHGFWDDVGRSPESSRNRSPDAAVLFYVTDDDSAGKVVEPLIRKAGFEPGRWVG